MFGGLWMVLFWGGIILLMVWGIKKLTERGGSGSGYGDRPSPIDVLKDRYAKGEISRQEFEQMKRDLS